MTLSKAKFGVIAISMVRGGLVLAAGIFAYQHYIVPAHVAAATTAQVLASSNQSSNGVKYYTLSSYGYMRGQADWPTRSMGCPSNGKTYKTLPWLADNVGPSTAGTSHAVSNGSAPQYYTGNDIMTSGNCTDRYTDGGGTGAWLSPTALGGWATNGAFGGFSGAYSGYTTIGSCSGLYGGGAQVIWGYPGQYGGDQMYGSSGLLSQNGYSPTTVPASPKDWQLYSNGTTLIRNSFSISTDQYNAIQSGYSVKFYAFGDDWMRVFLNGVLIGTTTYSGGSILTTTLPKSYFNPGSNLIAIQVSDKAIWHKGDLSGRGAGACYNLTGDLPDTSSPPVDVCPNIAGTQSSIPAGMIKDGSGNCVTPPASVTLVCDLPATTWHDASGSGYKFYARVKNPSSTTYYPTNNAINGTYIDARYKVDGGAESGATSIFATSGPSSTIPPGGTMTETTTGVVALTPGTHMITWRFIDINGTTLATCTDFVDAAMFKPYLSVYGGDAMAGSSPSLTAAGITSCAGNASAGFTTWNNNGAPDFAGAGVQIAAYALGTINYFATGLNSVATAPTGLSFSNSSAAIGTGNYGGSSGLTLSSCDYTSSIGSDGETVEDLTGNYTLGVQTLAEGARRTVHVTGGNVVVAGNILYSDTTGWIDTQHIPDFKLIVEGGNILIDHVATSLSGTYVAIPKNGVGGNIYTCTNGSSQYVPTSASYYPSCNTQLTVYGSFVAKKVYFQRTYGNLADAAVNQTYDTSKAAEVFVYTPELWIPRTSSNDPSAVDSITGLAPVL